MLRPRRGRLRGAVAAALCAPGLAGAAQVPATSTGFTGAEVRLEQQLTQGRFTVAFRGAACSGVRFGLSLVAGSGNNEHEIALKAAQEFPEYEASVTTWDKQTGQAQSQSSLTGVSSGTSVTDLSLTIEWRADGVSFLAAGAQILDATGSAVALSSPGMLGDALYGVAHRLHVYALPSSSRDPSAACLPALVSAASAQHETANGAGGWTVAWQQSSFASGDLGAAAAWRPITFGALRAPSTVAGSAAPLSNSAAVAAPLLTLRTSFVELSSAGNGADVNGELNVNATLGSEWQVASDGTADALAIYDYAALDVGELAIEVRNTGASPTSLVARHTVTLAASTTYCTLLRVRTSWARTVSLGVLSGQTLVANKSTALVVNTWTSVDLCYDTPSTGADTVRVSLGSHSGLILLHPHVFEIDYVHTYAFGPQNLSSSPPAWNGTELLGNSDFSSALAFPWVVDAQSQDWSVIVDGGRLAAFCSNSATAIKVLYRSLTLKKGTPYRLQLTASLSSGAPTGSPTGVPSTTPTANPTGPPTRNPTAPTVSPSSPPTASPTKSPSAGPTAPPSKNPSTPPSAPPTKTPSGSPTINPTTSPSSSPTVTPTAAPTASPASFGGASRRRLLQTVSARRISVAVQQLDSSGTATTACGGQSVLELTTLGAAATVEMVFDCPLAGAGTAHQLSVSGGSTFAQNDLLLLDSVSLQQWRGTLPSGPALPFSPADADRSNQSANPFTTTSSSQQGVAVIHPTPVTPQPVSTPAPPQDLALEAVYGERYSHRLISFSLKGILPQQIVPPSLRDALSALLGTTCPKCASSNANNVKLVRLCRYGTADFPYLPHVNATVSYEAALIAKYPYDCRGLSASEYGQWTAANVTDLANETNQTFATEVTLMLVNVNPPQGSSVVQVAQNFTIGLEALAASGGQLGAYTVQRGSSVLLREPAADPRPITPVPTPAPREQRSALDDMTWGFVLVGACLLCVSVGCGTAQIALWRQDRERETEEGGELLRGNEPVPPEDRAPQATPRQSISAPSEPYGHEEKELLPQQPAAAGPAPSPPAKLDATWDVGPNGKFVVT
eukprot:TRINITY_DN50215_c0_g1_i1.p1 TRINITY_DN50215_c0_g1~~TRINITY_DN50215_c0_g1_i1.p1  ORF type:complete len:1072 (+),score=300.36 TRINITY_DN50215_c0_g1_i1:131-3346(+)